MKGKTQTTWMVHLQKTFKDAKKTYKKTSK